MTRRSRRLGACALLGLLLGALLACDDAKNAPASAACLKVVSPGRQGDLTSPCHACCMEHNAKRGGMQGSECVCVGRAANSGLDRESQ